MEHADTTPTVIQLAHRVEEHRYALEVDRVGHEEQVPELVTARLELRRAEVAGVDRHAREGAAVHLAEIVLARHAEVEQRVVVKLPVVPVVMEADQVAILESADRRPQPWIALDKRSRSCVVNVTTPQPSPGGFTRHATEAP